MEAPSIRMDSALDSHDHENKAEEGLCDLATPEILAFIAATGASIQQQAEEEEVQVQPTNLQNSGPEDHATHTQSRRHSTTSNTHNKDQNQNTITNSYPNDWPLPLRTTASLPHLPTNLNLTLTTRPSKTNPFYGTRARAIDHAHSRRRPRNYVSTLEYQRALKRPQIHVPVQQERDEERCWTKENTITSKFSDRPIGKPFEWSSKGKGVAGERETPEQLEGLLEKLRLGSEPEGLSPGQAAEDPEGECEVEVMELVSAER